MARVQKGSKDKIYYLCEGKKARRIQMETYFPQKYILDKGNIALLLWLLLIFTAARTRIMMGTLQLFYLYFSACWVHMAQEIHLSHYFKNSVFPKKTQTDKTQILLFYFCRACLYHSLFISDLVHTIFIAKMDAISCDKAAYFANILRITCQCQFSFVNPWLLQNIFMTHKKLHFHLNTDRDKLLNIP